MPKTTLIAAALLIAWTASTPARAADRITVGLEVHVNGMPSGGTIENQLRAGVRRELDALGDVDVAAPGAPAQRFVRILAESGSGLHAVSVIVTERYDRQTLMVFGIEDDDLANAMMALHIVNGHWIFTGTDVSDLAKRIVASVDSVVLAKSRTLKRPQ